MSSSSAAISSEVPSLGWPEDKDFWEEYFKRVTDEDICLITRWQKILDNLLVYVCFLPYSIFDTTTHANNSEILGWTLHRRLDGVHHPGVGYVSTGAEPGRCDE